MGLRGRHLNFEALLSISHCSVFCAACAALMVIISSIGNEAQGNEENHNHPWYAFQDDEIWHKYYSSSHRILLVGEGDFSFSLCLAKSFGSASNIFATSLDSYAALIRKYKQAKENVRNLKKLGATVVHEVDATRMKLHPDIGLKKFDRIVYNFPHAGFKGKEDDLRLISKHRNLVSGFLHNARSMLRPDGEIHVNHKTTAPFSSWNLPHLASCNSLISLKPVDFEIEDFPGYRNKRGDGSRSDEKFPLGNCSTFRFVLPYKKHKACNLYPAPEGLENIPFPCQSHSLINDQYESNSIRDSFGIARPPLFHSSGIVWSHLRDSLGIYRPPISHSPEIVRPPPPRSFDFVPFERETYSVMSPSPPFGIYRPPISHSPEIVRPPPPRSFDFVPFERETYSVMSPSPPFGIARLPLFHSPEIVRRHPRHSFDIVPLERETSFSFMSPTRPPHGMVSSMLEDNTNIPRHINMRLSERRRSFDGYWNRVEERYTYAADKDPRTSARGYPH